jgi:hypothetical protein
MGPKNGPSAGPYIVRIVARQPGGRHVKVENYNFETKDGAHLFAVKHGLDKALTVDLFKGPRFVRSYTGLRVA